jgi:hypothetical protein
MRIGLIVDGQAEFHSLPLLLRRVETPHVLIDTLLANMHPYAPIPQIIKAMTSRVTILSNKGANMIIALLDREERDVCPGAWASEIAQAMRDAWMDRGVAIFSVVIKNSCYENWLVADTTAFDRMPRRFRLPAADIARIVPNKADSVNAQLLLRSAAQKEAYSKVVDAKKIMSIADPLEMAANSRSFRRLLRQLEHPRYVRQSRRP